MRNPKVRLIFRPQRLEVDREADLATTVHLGRLAVQLRQFDLRRGGRIGYRNLELQVKLIS